MLNSTPTISAFTLAIAALSLSGCAPAEVATADLDLGADTASAALDTGMEVVFHRSDCEGSECTDPEDKITVDYTGKICFKLPSGNGTRYEFTRLDDNGGCPDGWNGPMDIAYFVDQRGYTLLEIALSATEYPEECVEEGCVPVDKILKISHCDNVTCSLSKVLDCETPDAAEKDADG